MTTTTTQSESLDNEEAPPEPTFDALALTDDVRRAIDEMGYVNPTSVQLATYDPATAGRDLIVQSRTGTGKTAAFGIPIVDKLVRRDGGVQALILAPTRELALQSSRELERIGKHVGIETAAVYGGAPMERQVRQLNGGAQIVSGTPGRVLDHLKRGTLDPSGLNVLVLDEADEMLSMGFAKELNAIIELLPRQRQTLLFSATVEENIQRVADRHMTDPKYVSLSSDQIGATTISHFTYFIRGTGRSQDLVRILEIEDPESAIIFCNTKKETESVAGALKQAGFNAEWLNGDLAQSERERIMGRTRKGELRYLVATDVAARGIDISHVTHVINYTFPPAVEQYIHRTGRTGRAGRTGTAISLVSPQEIGSLYYLRLQYKIFPVERSLPTAGEQQTRTEVDRLELLTGAFPGEPSEIDRAVARRLLTHPEAERMLGGLLSTFFGSKTDPDEEAAAARRSRAPEPAPEPPVRASRESQPVARKPVERQPVERQPVERQPVERQPVERQPIERKPVERQPVERKAIEEAATVEVSSPFVRERPETNAEDDSDETGELDSDVDRTRLYVNVGRRDGMRAGDIARILRDHSELRRSDIGRIRVRDKHAFVDVPSEKVDELLAALAGQKVGDRDLVVEPAKSEK